VLLCIIAAKGTIRKDLDFVNIEESRTGNDRKFGAIMDLRVWTIRFYILLGYNISGVTCAFLSCSNSVYGVV